MPSGSPVFAALVEAMVPPGGAFAAGGLDLVSAADLDSFIGGRGLPAARGLRLGLRLLDLCPFLLAPRHGRRFSRLALAERIAVLEAWERSRLVPLRQLVAFTRVKLAKGEKKQLAFTVPASAMSVIDDDGKRRVHPTKMAIAVGGCQPGDAKAVGRGVGEPVGVEVSVTGESVEMER